MSGRLPWLEIRGVAKGIQLALVPLCVGACSEGQRDFEGTSELSPTQSLASY